MPEYNTKPTYVKEAKKRCFEMKMNPTELRLPKVIMTAEALEQKRLEYEEILSVVQFFGRKILDSLKGTPILIIIAEKNGFILQMDGDETIKELVAELGIMPGIQFAEEDMGMNVVSLALRENQPVQLVGDDHYHEVLHGSACYAVPFHYADIGNLLGTIGIMTITEQQNPLLLTMLATAVDSIERELLLRKQNRKLDIMNQIMMESARNGIIITDLEGNIIEFNSFAERITGLKKQEILGKNVCHLEQVGEYISGVLQYDDTYEDIEIIVQTKETSERFVCLFDALPIRDQQQRIIGAFGQFRNITERYEAEEKYNYLAYHDELTGLPNRRHIKNKLLEYINEAKENFGKMALMFIDLDRFKLVNDTLGHSHGDLLLQQAAKRLNSCVGSGGVVGRMGGDEFVFLLPENKEATDAVQVADRIIEVFKEPFNMDGYEFHITTSIGIATYPQDGDDAETLMVHADTAMYRAKEQGKNNYVFFRENMHTEPYERITLENSLHRALEKQEFIVHYQPQIDSKTGDIRGLEALIRWQHPEFGLVSPGKFIPIAEETGLIVPIGEWVMREACLQNKHWQKLGLPNFRVAVNLSTQQFLKSNLIETVKRTLEETGLAPQFLELEITETMTMDVDYTIPTLKQLHELGVQISIDDFGTGYSSLHYLKEFSIHRLKIDQSFVREIMMDKNDASIVETIIAMAHNLGLEVIAEGVEEKEQLRFLQCKKCDEVQGYYFSKPIAAKEFEENFAELQRQIKNRY